MATGVLFEDFNEERIPDNKIQSFYDMIKHTVVCLMVIKPTKEIEEVHKDESMYYSDLEELEGDTEELGSDPKVEIKEIEAKESPSQQMIFGTGVVLGTDCILTANGVIKGAKYISFRHFEDTNFYTCEVIRHDIGNDLALLRRLSGKFTKHVKFGNLEDIEQGRNVYCISNPGVNSRYLVFPDTFTNGQIACPDILIGNNKYIQINNTHGSQTGSMGAPVFSCNGTFIGMVTKIHKPYDIAVRIDTVMEFFQGTTK